MITVFLKWMTHRSELVSTAEQGQMLGCGWDMGSKENYQAMIAKLEAANATVTAGDTEGLVTLRDRVRQLQRPLRQPL